VPSLAEALRAGVAQLQGAGIAGAVGDARMLLAHAAGLDPARLTLHLPDAMGPDVQARYDAALAARARHQPVAQITGQRLFWGRRFAVTPDTLDPRPETEVLVAEALRTPFSRVLDLGTGTGCILLSLLADCPQAQGIGADISPAALAVAQRNAAALGLSPRARFVQSDWFAAVSGGFDLIVSNPPYIAAAEMAQLAPDVALWEPHLALTPGGDGLAAYRTIAAQARAHLHPGGRLLLEIGPTQGAAVSALLQDQGFPPPRILPDLDGRPRVVATSAP
jgi:release factor glutamine methyltransferase